MKTVVLTVNEEQFKTLEGLQFWKSYGCLVGQMSVGQLS